MMAQAHPKLAMRPFLPEDTAVLAEIFRESITQLTAEVFNRAGLDYGILYDAEQNSGNDVRRIGEEGLFEMLVEKNVAALSRCDYKAIVTTDPHSYNALKHEYPAEINGGRPILHYTELLDQLIASGQIKFNNGRKGKDFTVYVRGNESDRT